MRARTRDRQVSLLVFRDEARSIHHLFKFFRQTKTQGRPAIGAENRRARSLRGSLRNAWSAAHSFDRLSRPVHVRRLDEVKCALLHHSSNRSSAAALFWSVRNRRSRMVWKRFFHVINHHTFSFSSEGTRVFLVSYPRLR